MFPEIRLLSLVFFFAVFSSCKKDENSGDCFPGESTVRQVTDKQATIINQNGKYYIIEQFTIDTRLNPCNLAAEFQVNNLVVIISGNVKSTVRNGYDPCCTENFVITKISR